MSPSPMCRVVGRLADILHRYLDATILNAMAVNRIPPSGGTSQRLSGGMPKCPSGMDVNRAKYTESNVITEGVLGGRWAGRCVTLVTPESSPEPSRDASDRSQRLKPNARLRRLRIDKGWTRDHLASLIGFSVDTVKDWERGRVACPHPGSLAALSSVFHVGIDQLGFDLDRGPTVSPGGPEFDPTTQDSSDLYILDGLTRATTSYERLRRQLAGNALLELLQGHLRMMRTLLQESLSSVKRTRLLGSLSQVTSLVSWLHYFDRGDRAEGRRWAAENLELAEASNESQLVMLGRIRAAEQAVHDGRSQRGIELIDAALALPERSTPARARSWALAAQAQAYARLGQAGACQALLDRAAEQLALANSLGEEEPSWVEFWDDSRLSGYAGTCYLMLRRSARAREALSGALAGAEESQVKYRSTYLVDLAAAYAQERDTEQACGHAELALALAAPLAYELTLERLRGLRIQLRPWSGDRYVDQLEEKLRVAPV